MKTQRKFLTAQPLQEPDNFYIPRAAALKSYPWWGNSISSSHMDVGTYNQTWGRFISSPDGQCHHQHIAVQVSLSHSRLLRGEAGLKGAVGIIFLQTICFQAYGREKVRQNQSVKNFTLQCEAVMRTSHPNLQSHLTPAQHPSSPCTHWSLAPQHSSSSVGRREPW